MRNPRSRRARLLILLVLSVSLPSALPAAQGEATSSKAGPLCAARSPSKTPASGGTAPAPVDTFGEIDTPSEFVVNGATPARVSVPVSGRLNAAVRGRIPAIAALARTLSLQLLAIAASLGVVAAMVLFFLRQSEHGRFMTNTRLSIMDKEVQRACRYVEKNHRDPDLGLDALCAALVTGAAFLQALFERELGMPVEEFVTQVRINHARQIVENSGVLSPQEIAGNVGFHDSVEFLAAFKRITGSGLDEYRAAIG